MLEKGTAIFEKLINVIPFTAATWFVLATMLFFVWLFSKAHRDPESPVRWEDLVISTINGRADPYKIGYLVGIIVSTWIVIGLSDKDKLTFDIFGLYLAYLVGGAGWNMVMSKRQLVEGQKDKTKQASKLSDDAVDDTPKLPK